MDRVAAVMSSLAPLVGSARPPKGTPAQGTRVPATTAGAGERMRRETSSALEQALTKGKLAALAHYGLKSAAVPLASPMPAAQGLAAPHPLPQPGYALTPHEETQAQQLRGMGHTQRQDALGLNTHVPPATAPATPAGPSRMQQFMHPMKRGLGLAALGAAGAAAYGMHSQNQNDRDAQDLVYAPMQGAY